MLIFSEQSSDPDLLEPRYAAAPDDPKLVIQYGLALSHAGRHQLARDLATEHLANLSSFNSEGLPKNTYEAVLLLIKGSSVAALAASEAIACIKSATSIWPEVEGLGAGPIVQALERLQATLNSERSQ